MAKCVECGKPIAHPDGPYSNSNGGPWHRLCIPPRALTDNLTMPTEALTRGFASQMARSRGRPVLKVVK